MPNRLPDFIIAGAMRSGSTSLYRYIGAHPQVFVAPKELQFFTERFGEGIDWYAAQFAAAPQETVLGEATADYLARNTAMMRIHEVLPDVRLVASLRNPSDRAFSHHGLLAARGKEKRSFAAAVGDELNAVARSGESASGIIYLSHSMYDVHLERVLRLFGREQLLVTVFERMIADPASTYAALCRFLGVDDSFVPRILGKPVNPYVGFRSLRVRTVAQRLPKPLATAVAKLNTKSGAVADPPDEATWRRLGEFFAPRIERVEELLERPLPEWR